MAAENDGQGEPAPQKKTEIDSEMFMIRSVLSLRPKAGGSQDLLRFFRDRRIPERALASPGCLGVEVQALFPDGDEVLVTALWASVGSYQTWLQSAGRHEDGVQMQPLLSSAADAVGAAKLYEVGPCARHGA
ncbi:antibiotic biosynthesis monooxygenase [Ensifer sp. HO-A22]|uniref:Antibiotic biosynthesis monooxygenase n=1 Tax=Ensifer oleiphilus TaxID=2742698 RepID=A0A7Y6UNU6_9HYPH|nr:antibiotic biosynthesis monooxygenase family protein [Ensifer oleiphilus]NVD39993.1 antibiotic biosynthesis monooxygenase [Ensifer oleiphilus]